MPRVLIIEDEPDLLLGLRDNCEYEGYEVFVANDGVSGIQKALETLPDVILLDVMLPKLSGLDVCHHLRRRGMKTPIVILTARGQEMDKVVGFESGADDYVTKPFGIQELLARIRAHLRRSNIEDLVHEYSFGDVELNFRRHEARKSGCPLELSPREFGILKYFALHEGEVITRDQLLEKVWGYNAFPLSRTVDNHIAKLRQKVDSTVEPRHIITVHRVGYKFLR